MTNANKDENAIPSADEDEFWREVKKELALFPKQVRHLFIHGIRSHLLDFFDEDTSVVPGSTPGTYKSCIRLSLKDVFCDSPVKFVAAALEAGGFKLNSELCNQASLVWLL